MESFILFFALLAKKSSEHGGTFIAQHTTPHFGARVYESLAILFVSAKPGIAALLVVGTKYNATYACVVSGSRTHYAGLECYIECAFIQIFSAQAFAGGCKGLHFGMGSKVLEVLGEIVAPCNDASPMHNDTAHRYLTTVPGMLGLPYSLLHEVLVLLYGGEVIHPAKLVLTIAGYLTHRL